MSVTSVTNLDPIIRLSRDLKEAAATLSPDEARYLVDAYYGIQEYRKAAGNQIKALEKSGEPHSVIRWLFDQMETLEAQIVRALKRWTEGYPEAEWAQSIVGIGPVIAAGLLAHIDITDRPYAGQIWKFAGLDPTQEWKKGEKRPWNARLKVLAWKIGESFVKVSGNPEDFYGQLYLRRKEHEWRRNLAGEYSEQSKVILEKRTFKKKYTKNWYEGKYDPKTVKRYLDSGKNLMELTEAKKGGVPMLPPAQIHARSKRFAVKMFLSHYHAVAYYYRYGKMPPDPFVIKFLGHTDFVPPPNFNPKVAAVASKP
jgi:hypothetical protein